MLSTGIINHSLAWPGRSYGSAWPACRRGLILVMGASTAGDIAASVAAAATLGLFIAAWIAGRKANQQLGELRQQREDQLLAERRRRVYAHLAQLFDSDFVKMTAEAQRLFKAGQTLDDTAWLALWESKNNEEKARILAVMNFYENRWDGLESRVVATGKCRQAGACWKNAQLRVVTVGKPVR
jgi:hypothetical protein